MKTHAAQILGSGKCGVDFFQILGNAAGNRENVEYLQRRDPECGITPELDALGGKNSSAKSYHLFGKNRNRRYKYSRRDRD